MWYWNKWSVAFVGEKFSRSLAGCRLPSNRKKERETQKQKVWYRSRCVTRSFSLFDDKMASVCSAERKVTCHSLYDSAVGSCLSIILFQLLSYRTVSLNTWKLEMSFSFYRTEHMIRRREGEMTHPGSQAADRKHNAMISWIHAMLGWWI